jgi:hypothetical protein
MIFNILLMPAALRQRSHERLPDRRNIAIPRYSQTLF